jgi:DNA-binding transcriptional ArsR family regulator
MEDEVKISRELLKTISADTRVEILKALEERPMTASELSRFLKKHVTTISEHLDLLKNSNLVERVERPGRKWVYYKLSKDGKKILHPTSYRWVMILSISFLAILTGFFVWNVEAYPGDLFYPIKRARENLQLFFTFDNLEKANKHLQLAEERLKEAKVVIERGNEEMAKHVIQEYIDEMKNAKNEVEKTDKLYASNTLESIGEITSKDIFIIQNLKIKAPGLSKQLDAALNVSIESHKSAVKQLGKITGRAYSELIPQD